MTLVQVPDARDAATSTHIALREQPAAAPANRAVAHESFTEQAHAAPSTPTHNNSNHNTFPRATRQARKPSAGLAARLKALGFGKESRRRQSSHDAAESIGRIPEDQIRQIDLVHRSNSVGPQVQRRGRAWSSQTTVAGTPQIVGDSAQGFSIEIRPPTISLTDTTACSERTRDCEVRARRNSSAASLELPPLEFQGQAEMDPLKYRLPDHVNGNGTKATPDIGKAHIERDSHVDDYDETPPPPISKDEANGAAPGAYTDEVQSYFNPLGLQRTGSIYTLSRVSFASQLAQLTSLQLPDAESLSRKVSSIGTSQSAARALTGAAEQIQGWISKASEVLGGLDADDDVEWAAAGGREGLAEVDNAITRFEELINVYVSAIEDLQCRDDISNVLSEELTMVVTQVETILDEWEKVRKTLTGVKGQVEIAMEWEELWNSVLGDIGNEMDELSRLVFEMEEKRHRSLVTDSVGEGVDIAELETIVEETPPASSRHHARNRFSIANFPIASHTPQTPTMAQDDSSLLALFARMQPLRASLDFLPMRLSAFNYRAEEPFPTTCAELEQRREGLETNWKRLEKDADSLRRELGEDRWVLVFRGAGRQAQKLYDSVERSLVKLEEAVELGAQLSNPVLLGQRIESYDRKKLHYGPAIERVLAIIEKGLKDRFTVNGEVIRLHSEIQSKWDSLKDRMRKIDLVIEDLQNDAKNQQLRDSISTLMSNDRSTVGSGNATPGSSPASSVIMSGLQGGLEDQSTPSKNGKPRLATYPSSIATTRHISTPYTASTHIPRRGSNACVSSYGTPASLASPSPQSRDGSATPTSSRLPRPNQENQKPRWNGSVKTEGITGHNFKPLNLTTPSPHARPSPIFTQSTSALPPTALRTPSSTKLPPRSPLASNTFSSPISPETGTPSKLPTSRLPYHTKITTPGPYSQQALASSSASKGPRLQAQASTPHLATSNRRASFQPSSSTSRSPAPRPGVPGAVTERSPLADIRPSSSLAKNPRRVSMLPTPARGRRDSSVTGRESPIAVAGAAHAIGLQMREVQRETSTFSQASGASGRSGNGAGEKPRWR